MTRPISVLVEGNILRWNPRRGIPRVYREVLPRLAAACSDIHLVLAHQGHANWRMPAISRIDSTAIAACSLRLRPWRFWSVVGRGIDHCLAASFWRNVRADVFHSTSYEMPAVAGPSVALVHDMLPERYPRMFPGRSWRRLAMLKRRTIKRADVVLCVSRNTQRDVVELLGESESRCRVSTNGGFIPSGLDGGGVKPEGLRDRPFVLYVGGTRIGYKNFAAVVRCVGSMGSGEWREFDVVAAGPESPTDEDLNRYSAWIASERLHFLTDCTDANLIYLYGQCAVFVMPSLYEGFGIPVVEALSCGAPVACSSRASLPEVGGDAVEYFDPESVDEFRFALERAFSQGRSPQAVARRRAQASKFTWEACADRFAQAVRDVAGTR